MDMAARERIASDVLGFPVKDGDTMPCRFWERHTRSNGSRDMRVCLSPGPGGELPTFHCFHSSCADDWRPLNRELRSKIWKAEHGFKPAKGSAWGTGERVAPEPKAPPSRPRAFDLAALRSLYRPELKIDRQWFKDRSPVRVQGLGAPEYLRHLYRAGEKVLIFDKFRSQGQFLYCVPPDRFAGGWRLGSHPQVKAVKSALPVTGLEGVWYLCQPVDGKWYPNPRNVKDGKMQLSRRSQESVTDWRYMVLESDNAPEDLWLCFLALLPMPIAAIYSSAGASMHALVRVFSRSKPEWDNLKRILLGMVTRLGADSGCLSAVRLTRLPSCLREGKTDREGRYIKFPQPVEQELIYLNPEPDQGGCPIAELFR